MSFESSRLSITVSNVAQSDMSIADEVLEIVRRAYPQVRLSISTQQQKDSGGSQSGPILWLMENECLLIPPVILKTPFKPRVDSVLLAIADSVERHSVSMAYSNSNESVSLRPSGTSTPVQAEASWTEWLGQLLLDF